jgi:GTPase
MPALARIHSDAGRPVRAPRRASGSAELIALPRAEADVAGSLHVLTCGSVDDGKSTLIGRMLWDAGALHADQQEALRKGRQRPPARRISAA